eukprot:m.1225952 g.1225952  ORF g.1225952 m.1225952 type:complete len:300 (-) comp24635_c0_seq13:751-1650(-)
MHDIGAIRPRCYDGCTRETVSDAPRVCVAVGDGSAWRPLLVASLTVCCLACCFRLRTVRLPWVAGALLLGFCRVVGALLGTTSGVNKGEAPLRFPLGVLAGFNGLDVVAARRLSPSLLSVDGTVEATRALEGSPTPGSGDPRENGRLEMVDRQMTSQSFVCSIRTRKEYVSPQILHCCVRSSDSSDGVVVAFSGGCPLSVTCASSAASIGWEESGFFRSTDAVTDRSELDGVFPSKLSPGVAVSLGVTCAPSNATGIADSSIARLWSRQFEDRCGTINDRMTSCAQLGHCSSTPPHSSS